MKHKAAVSFSRINAKIEPLGRGRAQLEGKIAGVGPVGRKRRNNIGDGHLPFREGLRLVECENERPGGAHRRSQQ